jgi:hypothetical protein
MTSVLDQEMAVHVKHLKRIPAKVRGLSVEPLWEEVNLDLDGIDWVIVGGESGKTAKLFDIAWARALRDRCLAEGKAFFMKQFGANSYQDGQQIVLQDPHGGDWNEWPEDLRLRDFPAHFRPASEAGAVGRTEPEKLPSNVEAADSGDLPLFIELHKIVIRGLEAFLEAGEALEEIRRRELWRSANFANWNAYCESIVGVSKVHANRLIRAAQVWRSIIEGVEPVGSSKGIIVPRSESQLRSLGRLSDPGQQREAWTRAASTAGGQPTAKQVADAVEEIVGLPRVRRRAAKPANESLHSVIVEVMELVRGHASHEEIESRLRDALALTEEGADLGLVRAS